jgi:hypothetical protein
MDTWKTPLKIPLGSQPSHRPIQGQGRIAGEMARAVGSLRKLRGYLWVMAGLTVVGGVLWSLGVMEEPAPEHPATDSVIYLGMACFLAMAALFVEKKPVAWTLATAVVLTVVNTVILMRGGFPGILPLLVCIMSWVAVPRAGALERLLVMYPDLRFSRRLKGTL